MAAPKKDAIQLWSEQNHFAKEIDKLRENGLQSLDDLRGLSEDDIKQLALEAKIGVLFRRPFIAACLALQQGENATAAASNDAHYIYSSCVSNPTDDPCASQSEHKYADIDVDDDVDDDVKQPIFDVVLETMKCSFCTHPFPLNQLFICNHADCHAEGKRIQCEDCGRFLHCPKKKTHRFGPALAYVLRVSDRASINYKDGQQEGWKFNVPNMGAIEKILWANRWKAASVMINVNQFACGAAVNGAVTGIAATGFGGSVIAGALVPHVLGGALGAGIGFLMEGAFIWRQYTLDRLTKEQRNHLLAGAAAANVSGAVTFTGAIALGAALGTPAGPIGWAIGAIIAGIAMSLGARYGVHKFIEHFYRQKNNASTEIQKDALLFFFDDAKYKIDGSEECKKKLMKKYHMLAQYHHPDKCNGNADEFLKLTGYYGVLTAVWEKKAGKDTVDPQAMDDGDKETFVEALIFDNLAMGDCETDPKYMVDGLMEVQ